MIGSICWNSITSDSLGKSLVASSFDSIYISTSSGSNWSKATASANKWTDVVISSTGSIIVAVDYGGGIWISRYGQNSTSRSPTKIPTTIPTTTPVAQPSPVPTYSIGSPTPIPTYIPGKPTPIPTSFPSLFPTTNPTIIPTLVPTSMPTLIPSEIPTPLPTTPALNYLDIKIQVTGTTIDAINVDAKYSRTLQDAIALVVEIDKSYIKVGSSEIIRMQSLDSIIQVSISLYYPTTDNCQEWLSQLATKVYDGSLTTMIKYKATYSGSTSLKTVTSTPSMSTTSFCVLDTIAPTIGPTPPPTYLPTSSPTYVFYKPTPSPTNAPSTTYSTGSPITIQTNSPTTSYSTGIPTNVPSLSIKPTRNHPRTNSRRPTHKPTRRRYVYVYRTHSPSKPKKINYY